MNITSAQIRLFKKGSFHSVYNEGVRHIKVLPYLSIVQSLEGSYEIALGNGAPQQTGDGGFFIAPSNIQQTITHHVNEATQKMSCRWIFLDVEVNKAFMLDRLYQFPAVIRNERKAELSLLFDRMFETDSIWKNYSDCCRMIDYLLPMATPIPSEMHPGVQRAAAYMAEYYAELLTIETLASVANMSESNFYAAFKKHMGSSPIAYLNNYRLSLAADKLMDLTDSVSEISYSVGIGDPLYFSRLFKRVYGMTPIEYRRVYGKQRGEVQN